MDDIEYRTSPTVEPSDLTQLFARSWDGRKGDEDYAKVLERSLGYVCAYHDGRLVGFVNVAWDGGSHGFVLDTTVVPEMRRRGIGTELLRRAESIAREHGLEWLHVDFPPELRSFYRGAGYRPTEAGLLKIVSNQ